MSGALVTGFQTCALPFYHLVAAAEIESAQMQSAAMAVDVSGRKAHHPREAAGRNQTEVWGDGGAEALPSIQSYVRDRLLSAVAREFSTRSRAPAVNRRRDSTPISGAGH